DADEHLDAAGGGQAGEERGLLAEPPIDLSEPAGIRGGECSQQIICVRPADEGVVVSQFKERTGIAGGNRGEFAAKIRDRLQAMRAEQATRRAEFAGQRAASLGLKRVPRPATVAE